MALTRHRCVSALSNISEICPQIMTIWLQRDMCAPVLCMLQRTIVWLSSTLEAGARIKISRGMHAVYMGVYVKALRVLA